MTETWETTDWTLTRSWISSHLGEEWAEASDFFGRMVGHFAVEAAPVGDLNETTADEIRAKIKAHIPQTLDEVVPFAARYCWDKSLQGEQQMEFFNRLQNVSQLAGAKWSISDLAARVQEILT